MQSFTCSKAVSVWPGSLSISRIFLIGLLAFSTPLTRTGAAPLCACPCGLAWNLCQDSTVCGYCLYYGVIGSTTTNRLDVGKTNLVTLNNLFTATNYFFYVTAYNSSGTESPPSVVMYYTPQALSALNLSRLVSGIVSLHFLTATGAACHVEFTPTLSPPQWQTLASAKADAYGNVTITDPLSGNQSARFYRTARP